MKEFIKKCLNYNCNNVYDSLQPFWFLTQMYGLSPYKWDPNVTAKIFGFKNLMNALVFLVVMGFYFYIFNLKFKEISKTLFAKSDLLTIGTTVNFVYGGIVVVLSYTYQFFMVRRIRLIVQTIFKIDEEVCSF